MGAVLALSQALLFQEASSGSHGSERTGEGYKLPWGRKSSAVFLKYSAGYKARPDKIQGGAMEGYFEGRFCKECVSFSFNRVSWTKMLKVQPLKHLYVARA